MQVDLGYDDGGGFDIKKTVALKPGGRSSFQWKLRPREGARTSDDYRPTHFMPGNVRYVTDWVSTDNPSLTINDPFQGAIDVRLLPVLSADEVIEATVDLDYEEPETGYRRSIRERFESAEEVAAGRDLVIPTLAADPAAFTYEISILRADGTVHAPGSVTVPGETKAVVISDGVGSTHRVRLQLANTDLASSELAAIRVTLGVDGVEADDGDSAEVLFTSSQTDEQALTLVTPNGKGPKFSDAYETVGYDLDGLPITGRRPQHRREADRADAAPLTPAGGHDRDGPRPVDGDVAGPRVAPDVSLPTPRVQAGSAAGSIVAPPREEIVVFRLPRVVMFAVLACVLAVPATASADDGHHAPSDGRLSRLLGDVWTTVLAMPSADNPLSAGGCVRLGEHVVAPFGPFGPPGTAELTCTVERGTKLFLAPATSECSNVEPAPYFAQGESALRDCARAADARIVTQTATLDGAPVALHEVVTGLLDLSLPADNVLGAPAGGAQSVAHGWVALLRGLRVGTHTIQTAVTGTVFGNVIDLTVTITVVVQARGDDEDHGDDDHGDDDDGDDGDDDSRLR